MILRLVLAAVVFALMAWGASYARPYRPEILSIGSSAEGVLGLIVLASLFVVVFARFKWKIIGFLAGAGAMILM